MKRGEIWTVAGAGFTSKPRPAMILQSDAYSETATVTVAPITSTAVDAPLMRIAVPANQKTGLKGESFLMIDKITTIRRVNVGAMVGIASRETLAEATRATAIFLGLAG